MYSFYLNHRILNDFSFPITKLYFDKYIDSQLNFVYIKYLNDICSYAHLKSFTYVNRDIDLPLSALKIVTFIPTLNSNSGSWDIVINGSVLQLVVAAMRA